MHYIRVYIDRVVEHTISDRGWDCNLSAVNIDRVVECTILDCILTQLLSTLYQTTGGNVIYLRSNSGLKGLSNKPKMSLNGGDLAMIC